MLGQSLFNFEQDEYAPASGLRGQLNYRKNPLVQLWNIL